MSSVDLKASNINNRSYLIAVNISIYQITDGKLTRHLYENYIAVNKKVRTLQRRRGAFTTDGDRS